MLLYPEQGEPFEGFAEQQRVFMHQMKHGYGHNAKLDDIRVNFANQVIAGTPSPSMVEIDLHSACDHKAVDSYGVSRASYHKLEGH